jgi:hypothetical protein
MGTSEKNSIFGEIYLFRDFLRQSLLPALFIPAPRSLYPCSPLSLSLLPALFIPAPRSPLQAHVLATSTPKASISAEAGNLLDNSLTKLSVAPNMCIHDDHSS